MVKASAKLAAWCMRRDAGLIIALIGLAGLVVFFGDYLSHAHPPRDRWGYMLGRDFVNTWMGARAVLNGTVGSLLNVDAHNLALLHALGPMPPHNWSYPPALLLFIGPLGFFDYVPALALWSLVGYAAYVAASATFERSARYLILVAAAPVVAANLYSGQTGFFTAAVLILFFRFLDERPILSGAILGLMLCKPHLVLLFPLALLISGRWRTFVAAGGMAAALVGVTALVFGAHVWPDYFHMVVPVQRGVLDYGTGFITMMPTGFMHGRLMGLPLAQCWQIQVPFTLFGIGAVVWTFIKRRDPVLSAAVLLTASIIATPYSFNYDMVAFGWLTAMLWPRLTGFWDRVLLVAVWTLPLSFVGAGELHLPLGAPFLAFFLVRLLAALSPPRPAVAVQLP
jgi:alpha-1,2-mannosyltransferase